MKMEAFIAEGCYTHHDVDRIYSKLNDKRHLRPVYTLLYTLPGVPSLYYGSEWGIEGRKADGGDPALRPHLVLEEMEQHPNVPGLAEYLAFLGMCRKECLQKALTES